MIPDKPACRQAGRNDRSMELRQKPQGVIILNIQIGVNPQFDFS
jgi:hypothetical protein